MDAFSVIYYLVLVVAAVGTVAGIVDAIRQPNDRWVASGHHKALWIGAQVVFGPLGALVYAGGIRPEVAEHDLPGWFRKTGWYVALTAIAVVVLFPIYMTVVRAVSTPVQYINAGLPLHPVDFQPGAFRDAWTEGDLGSKMALSFVVTIVIASFQLVTSILAAYAFAFLRFPAKRLVFVLFMATLMLPIEVTLIPNVATMRSWELFNSVPGLTLPFLAAAFGVFLIRQGFLGVPEDLRDASRLDGYGHLAFLFKIAVPVTRPIIASFAVISLLTAWNQYLWPRAITTEGDMETIQIALQSLLSSTPERANIGIAGAVIAALPVLFLLIFLQKHLIRGLTAGAVKG